MRGGGELVKYPMRDTWDFSMKVEDKFRVQERLHRDNARLHWVKGSLHRGDAGPH